MLKDIKIDNRIEFYKTLPINEKISFKSNYYFWACGVALKHFNKATRKLLNKGIFTLKMNEHDLEILVRKLS